MATANQRYKYRYFFFKKKNAKPKLKYNPQVKGVTLRNRTCTPRKPNSARRQVVKLKLSTKKFALAHVPGSPHNLRKFSKVLINGNRCRDLPYVNYSCIRGVYDFSGLKRKRRRSIYGMKRDPELKTHIRRCLREKN